MTRIADRAPGKDRRRKARRAAPGSERLKAGIGRDVAGLAGVAKGGRHRAVEDETAKRQVTGFPVEVPGTRELRPEHPLETLRPKVCHQPVVVGGSGMDDADQRGVGGRDIRNEDPDGFWVAKIAGVNREACALGLKILEQLGHAGPAGGPAANEGKVPNASGNQPPRRCKTNAREPTGDKPGPIRGKDRLGASPGGLGGGRGP